jgi:hypothetical protein
MPSDGCTRCMSMPSLTIFWTMSDPTGHRSPRIPTPSVRKDGMVLLLRTTWHCGHYCHRLSHAVVVANQKMTSTSHRHKGQDWSRQTQRVREPRHGRMSPSRPGQHTPMGSEPSCSHQPTSPDQRFHGRPRLAKHRSPPIPSRQ